MAKPKEITRRQFLKQTSALAAGACATLSLPSIVRANSPWGQLPPSADSLPNCKILEIFLPGGASMWENFWVSQDAAGSTNNWRGLDDYVLNLQWDMCAGAPASSVETMEFGSDAGGTPVHWGPATAPLYQRSDIFNRARMVVTSHSDQLHGFAGHRALTGRPFGSPRSAGLGAAIQRRHQSLPDGQDLPFAYVLAPKNLGKPYFLTYATALGQHPGPARPLGLKVGDPIGGLLQRPGTSPGGDALFTRLTDQYRDLLRWQGDGSIVRSSDFDSFDAAAQYLLNANQLDDLLGGNALQSNQATTCVSDDHPMHDFGLMDNHTRRSMEVAAELLTSGARHVTVIDGGFRTGLLRDSSTPYDAHTGSSRVNKNVVEITSAHLFNVCQALAAVIDGSGGAGSFAGMALKTFNSGPKINLDDTLIRIHTEFNRTPNPGIGVNPDNQYPYAGRNHFPAANVEILIGGPVTTRGIHGGIGLEDGSLTSAVAIDSLRPTDVHAATLYAAGVDPLAPGNFTIGDDFSSEVNPGGEAYEEEIRTNLKHKVLGAAGDPGSIFTWGS